MNLLITGGAGYIGSHTIIEVLQNKDWKVFSIDNFINSSNDAFDRIEKITGNRVQNFDVNITDIDALKEVFNQIGQVDGIIHFAALKAVGESVEQPLHYYHNNLVGLLNILECCKTFHVPNLIFSSSCSIYGNVDLLPVDEHTELKKSESPYAATKAMGETILEDFAKVNTTKVISLRYFNPVGAHSTGWIGENPINKPNNLFPVITRTACTPNEQMAVFGSQLDTRDGSCIRDYVHVSDIATAHLLAMDYCMGVTNLTIDFFNLGTGNGVSVFEAIQAFEKISGQSLNYRNDPPREGDVVAIYSNSEKAERILGWKPKFDLNQMMDSAWKWQQNLNLEKSE